MLAEIGVEQTAFMLCFSHFHTFSSIVPGPVAAILAQPLAHSVLLNLQAASWQGHNTHFFRVSPDSFFRDGMFT